MKDNEQFAAWIAGAVLRAGEEEIQADVLSDIVENTSPSTSLDDRLTEVRQATRQAGDFGMEIIGPLLIPVLIEAGKQLWRAYLKSLSEKAGQQLAEITVTEAKKLVRRNFGGGERAFHLDEFELLVRQAAAKEGMPPEQVNSLIAAIRSEKLASELADGT